MVNAQGEPVPGANHNHSHDPILLILALSTQVRTVPAPCITNQIGEFALDAPDVIFSREEQESFSVNAMTGQQNPGGWQPSDENSYHYERPNFEPDAAASLVVKGNPGNTFHNLVITLAGKCENTVHGRLIANEESFKDVHVSASQNSMEKKVDKNADGTFTIAGIAAGDFTLSIYPAIDDITETTFETLTERRYITEHLKLNMPNNQKDMYVDITLRKNEILTGTLGHADGSPVRFAGIKVVQEKDSMYHEGSRTNHKGFFKIDQLISDSSYQLVFYANETHEKLYTSGWLSPLMREVHFVIK